MPFQHQVCASVLIPKPDAILTRAGDYPLTIMRNGDMEHPILVALHIQYALAERPTGVTSIVISHIELPILEYPVTRA